MAGLTSGVGCVFSRSRIKEACEQLRTILPGISLKTDKATVFECAVQYITYLRSLVGHRHSHIDQVRSWTIHIHTLTTSMVCLWYLIGLIANLPSKKSGCCP